MTKPQLGDIGLVRVTGWAGVGITIGELIYDGNWRQSHAFVYIGGGLIVEAQPGGARINALSRYAGRSILWSTRSLTLVQRRAISDAAMALQGVPYNWLDYLALGLWHFHIRIPAVRRKVNDGTSLMCSQLVDAAWNLGGVHIFADGRLGGDVTPGDLAREIAAGRL